MADDASFPPMPHVHPVVFAFGATQLNPLDPRTACIVLEVRQASIVTRYEIDPQTAQVLSQQLQAAVQAVKGPKLALTNGHS